MKAECGTAQGKDLMTLFAEYTKSALGLTAVRRQPNRVTIIGRRKYMAHPRVNVALMALNISVSRDIVNQDRLVAAIREQRPDLDARLVFMSPDSMSFSQQVQAALESQVIVAFHGAALAHLLFVPPPASILELSVPRYRARNHFAIFAQNMGADYMMHVFPRTAELPPRNSDRFEIPEKEFLEVLAKHIPDPRAPSTAQRNAQQK